MVRSACCLLSGGSVDKAFTIYHAQKLPPAVIDVLPGPGGAATQTTLLKKLSNIDKHFRIYVIPL
jgi:hypothetical protein